MLGLGLALTPTFLALALLGFEANGLDLGLGFATEGLALS